jgi:hypothetical protein
LHLPGLNCGDISSVTGTCFVRRTCRSVWKRYTHDVRHVYCVCMWRYYGTIVRPWKQTLREKQTEAKCQAVCRYNFSFVKQILFLNLRLLSDIALFQLTDSQTECFDAGKAFFTHLSETMSTYFPLPPVHSVAVNPEAKL